MKQVLAFIIGIFVVQASFAERGWQCTFTANTATIDINGKTNMSKPVKAEPYADKYYADRDTAIWVSKYKLHQIQNNQSLCDSKGLNETYEMSDKPKNLGYWFDTAKEGYHIMTLPKLRYENVVDRFKEAKRDLGPGEYHICLWVCNSHHVDENQEGITFIR